jgi:DNA-binding NarL/FixJ family response regulator
LREGAAMPTPTAEPAGPATKTLFLVDDHPVLRRGLTALIESEPDLAVLGVVGMRVAALDSIRKRRPDLVIVDLALGDEDGLDLVKEIKTRYPNIPSLVLSMHDEAVYAERALSAGAFGYVTKQQLGETVLSAIRRTLAGEIYMSEALQRRLAERYVGGHTLETAAPIHTLTDRELQVFRLKSGVGWIIATEYSLAPLGPHPSLPRKRGRVGERVGEPFGSCTRFRNWRSAAAPVSWARGQFFHTLKAAARLLQRDWRTA